MRAPHPLLAALLALPGLAGCSAIAVSGAQTVQGRHLTIYSSLPLDGAQAPVSHQIANGEMLALADAHGRAGRFTVGYVSLDDSSPASGRWEPGLSAANAKLAVQDRGSIAYLGDLNSGATAVSLPLTNAAGILQVSPGSHYVGLTSSLDAGQDDPQRFYPSGLSTFARLAPGDQVEAAVAVRLMRMLGIRRVYALSNEDPFHIALAQLVAEDAERAGMEVAGYDRLNLGGASEPAEFAGEAARVASRGAQAVFFSGPPEAGTAPLWRELHAQQPGLTLLGCHALAERAFTSQIGAAARRTLLTSPWLPPALYPAAAREVLSRYAARFHEPPGAYALYGYEAMSVTLQAIRDAGRHGNDRKDVIHSFFAIGHRSGVLGRYAIEDDGEVTLSRYGVDRVAHGAPAFWRALEAGS